MKYFIYVLLEGVQTIIADYSALIKYSIWKYARQAGP